jgi:hypothetical protein
VGPRAGPNRCDKSRPPPGFDPRTVQPQASRYTDYTTRLSMSPSFRVSSLFKIFKNLGQNIGYVAYFGTNESTLSSYQGNSSPKDCHLFTALKQNLGEHRFSYVREGGTVVTRWVVPKVGLISTRDRKTHPTI